VEHLDQLVGTMIPAELRGDTEAAVVVDYHHKVEDGNFFDIDVGDVHLPKLVGVGVLKTGKGLPF
jgi:hypothetical protein